MRWIKAAAVVVAALIAFVVLESAFHLLEIAAVVLAIGVVIAVAIKGYHRVQLAREHRAQVKEAKRQRKSQVRRSPTTAVAVAPPPPAAGVGAHRPVTDVDEELARLKREMEAR